MSILYLIFSFVGAAQGEECPVNDCAACGKTRQYLTVADPAAQNKGDCHVWKETKGLHKGKFFGCVTNHKCERHESGYKWSFFCGKEVRSLEDCRVKASETLTKAHCNAKLNCSSISSTLHSCEVESEYCMDAIFQRRGGGGAKYFEGFLGEQTNIGDIHYCPTGTKLVEGIPHDSGEYDFHVCSWPVQSTTPAAQVNSGPSTK